MDGVSTAYSIFSKSTGALGGGGDGGPIYGELTRKSMEKVVRAMAEQCGLGAQSRLLDIGAGLGKPNVHAALLPVEISYGVEVSRVRWELCMHVMKLLLASTEEHLAAAAAKCHFDCSDITAAHTLDPFTHIYMFDVGFPPALMIHIATAFNASTTPGHLVCFKNEHLILGYGFDVELVTKFPTSMHGSSEGHHCYVYKRTTLPIPTADPPIDAAFQSGISSIRAIQQSGAPVRDYTAFINSKLTTHWSRGRTRGERRRAATPAFAHKGY